MVNVVWLRDYKQRVEWSKFPHAISIVKVECEGHPLGKFCLDKTSWPQSNYSKADWEADDKRRLHLNMTKGEEKEEEVG
jgi:hypothetical protein